MVLKAEHVRGPIQELDKVIDHLLSCFRPPAAAFDVVNLMEGMLLFFLHLATLLTTTAHLFLFALTSLGALPHLFLVLFVGDPWHQGGGILPNRLPVVNLEVKKTAHAYCEL